MSAAATSSSATPAGPSWVASLVPGLGHLTRGFVGPGLRFLSVFLIWFLALVFRGYRIPKLFEGFTLPNVLGLLAVVVLPLILVKLAHASLSNLVAPRPREGMGAWQLAFRDLRRNQRAIWGAWVLSLLYTVCFLAVLVAPYDPTEEGGGGVLPHKLLKPGATAIHVANTISGEELAARDWMALVERENAPDLVVLKRGLGHRQRMVFPAEALGEPSRGWARAEGVTREMTIGKHTFPYRTETYPLGTDSSGRDLLSRLLYGGQISLLIGFVAMFVAVTLGVLFGATAGYFGGFVDTAIMRIVDILLAFPRLLLLLLIAALWPGASIFVVIVILGATGWMGVSRLVRAEFLRIKELDYTHAARSLGYGKARIMFRHLLPNSLAPVIVNATLLVGNTILVEAGLSFLGFGVQPPDASWGNIIADGRAYLQDGSAWWISTFPGLLIVLAVVCINLVGDALRDALDPKSK